MRLNFKPYDSQWVAALRDGGTDDYGLAPERTVSDGQGNPCRHCLDMIPKGAEMLICAARPFPGLQPYAETGPIFLCAEKCNAYADRDRPPALRDSPDYLLKGYSEDFRIIYGTGQIVAAERIEKACETLFDNANVAFVDVRSARNNCFQCRITRG